ncbi:MAG: Omp28-related outer membrane protein, partial [Bacteroidales bacterium]|nr:Omp28-related outer membrane protein [Bacteroidales bacterium]
MAMATASLALTAQQLVPQVARYQSPIVKKTTVAEGTMEYGYCGELATSLGFGMQGTFRSLMKIPAADAAKYAGAQITNVSVGVGSFSENPNAQIIILKDIQGSEPIYTQEFTPKKTSWNEVALETPYTINGEDIFVGFQISCSTKNDYPFGIDDQVANELGDYVGVLDEKSNKFQYLHLGEQGFGNNCIKLTLAGDNLPQYDLVLEELSINRYIKTGTEFSITGTIKNAAAQNINTFDLAYQIVNSEPVTQTITIDNGLANAQKYNFSIDQLSIAEDGTHEVTVTISNPNGMADESDSDNSANKSVTTFSTTVSRKMLLENFSTAQCGNCPRVHEIIKGIVKDRSDVAWVVHHSGYGVDDYTISESNSYLWFYGGGGTFAPAAMFDRLCLQDLGAEGAQGITKTPIFFPSNKEQLEEYIEYCLNQPTFISLNIADVYNEETRELTVKVSGQSTVKVEQMPNINIFLTEDGLYGYQSGGGYNYPHSHAIRKVMTSTWGDALTLDDENKFEVTYTCVLDNEWKPEHMSVIAFVADYNEANYNDCVVLNTEFKVLEYGASVGKLTNDECRVMAINKTISLNGNYKHAAVYSVDGRLVKQANGASAIALENAGVYIVVVDGTSHKVVIK